MLNSIDLKGNTKKVLEILLPTIASLVLLLWIGSGDIKVNWLVYILGTLFCGVLVLVIGNIREPLVVAFVLGLQMGVYLYLGSTGYGSRWGGSSGPGGIIISFVTIPATFLLLPHFLSGLTKKSNDCYKFSWGKEITYPAASVFLTMALTILYTHERLLVLYYLFELLQFYIVFLAIVNIIKSPKELVFVINLLMIVLAMQSVVYFIENILGVTFSLDGNTIMAMGGELQRHGGTISTIPAPFASFILPLLLIAISRFLTTNERPVFFRMGLLSAMGVGALVLTFTRAAWGGFVLGTLWLVLVGVKRRIIKLRRLAPLFVMGLIVITLMLPKIMIRMSADHEADFDERFALDRIAWNVIKANPLLGVGAGAYAYTFQQYIPSDLQNPEVWVYVVHNVYLLRWAETGIPGLLSLLLLFFVGMHQALICSRVRDETLSAMALGWSAGIISLMWEMLWDTSLGFQTNALIWFMFGLIVVVKRYAFFEPAYELLHVSAPGRKSWSAIR